MSDKTGIQWTDSTWPVVAGCTHVSPGCDHCYAARLTSGRLRHHPAYEGLAEHGRFNDKVRVLPGRLDWPARWRKPRRIFVSDMADLFHAGVPDGFIAQVWDVMGRSQQHTYQILTKRHARMKSWVSRWADTAGDADAGAPDGWPPMPRGPEALAASRYTSGRSQLFGAMLREMGTPPEGCAYPLYDWMEGQRFWERELFNVWLGVSAEDQHWANLRIPALLHTPAAVRFVSAEPLLGPVTLPEDSAGLHWLIIGGESGPGARPLDTGWVRDLLAQCHDRGITPFVKQLGSCWAREHGGDSHGGDWDRWPDDLRVRQFPEPVPA